LVYSLYQLGYEEKKGARSCIGINAVFQKLIDSVTPQGFILKLFFFLLAHPQQVLMITTCFIKKNRNLLLRFFFIST